MRKIFFIVSMAVTLISCATTQPARIVYNKSNNVGNNNSIRDDRYVYDKNEEARKSSNVSSTDYRVNKILSDAEKYLGVPYRLGGMTSSGFDCSGFVNKVFDENNIKLTRRSADQAKEGVSVGISNVREGDLLFFATAGGNRVSHVGIVHTINSYGEIKFIHASTSKGVIISSLEESYWNKAFLFARRVL